MFMHNCHSNNQEKLKLKVSMTLQLILVIAGLFDLSFLHDIIYLGEFALAPDLRVGFNSDMSECQCIKYCFPEIDG